MLFLAFISGEVIAQERKQIALGSDIESIFDELKKNCQIEHTRHRSPEGFIGNLISKLITYCYLPKELL